MYQDLSTRHDWPVEKVIVDWPIRMKENSKRTSVESVGGPEQGYPVADPGEGAGGPDPPPLSLDQNEAQGAEKIFFEAGPPVI